MRSRACSLAGSLILMSVPASGEWRAAKGDVAAGAARSPHNAALSAANRMDPVILSRAAQEFSAAQ